MSGRRAQVIVERLGANAAARLSLAVGGTRLHVPGQLHRAGRLKRILGDDLAILVVLHFGASRLYVPVSERAQAVDPAKVRRLLAKGWSSARIARRLECSERTIEAKRAQLRNANNRRLTP